MQQLIFLYSKSPVQLQHGFLYMYTARSSFTSDAILNNAHFQTNVMELEMIDVNSCSLPSDFQSGPVQSGPVQVFTKAVFSAPCKVQLCGFVMCFSLTVLDRSLLCKAYTNSCKTKRRLSECNQNVVDKPNTPTCPR